MKKLFIAAMCAVPLVSTVIPGVMHTGAVRAGDTVYPVKMSGAQIAGDIFKDFKPVVIDHENEKGPFRTEDVETFLSSDRQFDTGMYRSGVNRFEIRDGYGVDEFMYFLKGGVTLTNLDGTVMEIKAGDAVTIPRDWKGVWETEGYTKIYVIYSPDGPIE